MPDALATCAALAATNRYADWRTLLHEAVCARLRREPRLDELLYHSEEDSQGGGWVTTLSVELPVLPLVGVFRGAPVPTQYNAIQAAALAAYATLLRTVD